MKFDITKYYDELLKKHILSALHNDYMEWVANVNVGFAQTTAI